MGLPIAFTVVEYGGTDSARMQGSLDSQLTWQDITPYFALTVTNGVGQRTITGADGYEIDTTVFLPGETYPFRLIDANGSTISNVINYTIPGTGAPIEGEDGDDITGEDGDTING